MSDQVEIGALLARPGEPRWIDPFDVVEMNAQSDEVGRYRAFLVLFATCSHPLANFLVFAGHLRRLGLDDAMLQMVRQRVDRVATDAGLYALRVFVPEVES